MKTTWVLVAHRGGARIFEGKVPGKELALIRDIAHPEGRLKSRDLGTDEPGRSFDSHGVRHSMEQEQGLSAHVAEVFAGKLAGLLEEGRVGGRYDRLVLVAEPRFLGVLRQALSREAAALVTATVNKDLGHVEPRAMARHLKDIVPL